MLLNILLYFLKAQHVSGTTMPHHQELATILLITTLVVCYWFAVGWRLGAGRVE